MSELTLNQARNEIAAPSEPDTLAQALLGEVDNLTNIEFVIETGIAPHEVVISTHGQDAPANSSPVLTLPPQPPTTNPTHEATTHTDMSPDAITAMKYELVTAHATISSLNGEIAKVRTKCLQMENSLSSGRKNKYFFLNTILTL